MFDQLFRRRAAVRRHLNSPLLQERLEYLRYCAGRGYKLYTLRQLAQDLLRIQNLLGLPTSSKAIDPAAVEATVKRCVPRRKPHSNCKNWRQKEIFSHATQWLRFLKRLRLPQVSPPVYQPDVDWQRNLLFIFIPRTKGRRTEPYPLSPTVGEAIIRYLERVRPRSSYREIFLTVEAPIRPLSGAAIWRIVAKRARALDPPVVPH